MATFNDHGPGHPPEGPYQSYGEPPRIMLRNAEVIRQRSLYLANNAGTEAAVGATRFLKELHMLRIEECTPAEITELRTLADKCQSAIANARRMLVGLPLTATDAEVDAKCEAIRAFPSRLATVDGEAA